jgi:threonine/homoserine/homoserine lactone efflux protein
MFPDVSHIIFFLTATIILNLTPGSDVMYVASQSLHNLRQGIFAVLGVSTGIGFYMLISAFGLAGILKHSPLIFNLIKIAGAFYLFYLAWQALFKGKVQTIVTNNQDLQIWQSYKKGIFTNLLNPKVGIFFLTFLPQFVDVARGKIWLQLLTLGACFVISGTLVNTLYAFLFVYLKERLFSNLRIQQWLNKLTALVFCVLALKVLLTSAFLNKKN